MASVALNTVLTARPAVENDRAGLANLLHFETYVHRHFDWRRPIDWLGKQPYLVLEKGDRLAAALACPPDPEGVAWLRLFATTARVEPGDAWGELWPPTLDQLKQIGVHHLAAIPLQEWMRDLLGGSGFSHTHNVVVLDWRISQPVAAHTVHAVREMTEADLPAVAEADHAAFSPLWQNSLPAIRVAYEQAEICRLIEVDGRVAAFQICTPASQGIHLARLATHPDFQGRGLAAALVADLQNYAIEHNKTVVTVNTQDNNKPSLGLYTKLGFRLTGDQYPVFEYKPLQHAD
jgi:ribosomal-protein-alanine N-acetyltransferase